MEVMHQASVAELVSLASRLELLPCAPTRHRIKEELDVVPTARRGDHIPVEGNGQLTPGSAPYGTISRCSSPPAGKVVLSSLTLATALPKCSQTVRGAH